MGGKPRMRLGLAEQWRQWVSRSLVQESDPRDVVNELVRQGVSRRLAETEVDIAASTVAHLAGPTRRMRMVLDLLAQNAREDVPVRRLCGNEEFYERYFTSCQPVVFSDGCESMAAARWTWAGLKEAHGERVVSVATKGGTGELIAMAFADVVDQVTGDSDCDIYVTSGCDALRGGLSPLVKDLAPVPDFLDAKRARRHANLWLGPRGSLSPLHHDTTHVFFNQLVGQKQYTLIAPWAAEVLLGRISQPSDANFDLTSPGDVAVHTLVIEPGQSLFIPAGWWHQVESLDPAISVSLSCYHRTADFDWYRPVRHRV